MTENKDILKKLITDDNTKKFENLWTDDGSDKDEIMTVSRIVQVRYRFYAVWILLLILIVLFRLFLPTLDKYNAKKSELTNLRTQLESLENREKQYEESIWFVESINKNSDQIVDCLNQWESCQELPKEIKDELWLAKSYLLTRNLDNAKMDVDERKIIENIDMFLLKLEPFSNNSFVNGTLSRISIWDKESAGWLYKVPVQLDITFDDKESLLAFINNIEKYVPSDESVRVLYKIDRITYDVVNSDEPQDTTVYMNLYYFEE